MSEPDAVASVVLGWKRRLAAVEPDSATWYELNQCIEDLERATPPSSVELERLRRNYATSLLHSLHEGARFGIVITDVLDVVLEHIDPTVGALIRKHLEHPVGRCHDCDSRAPLMHKPERHYMFREMVCAWGCETPPREEEAPHD